MVHDWKSLVTHILLILRMPEYQNSEPICIIFPSDCSSVLNDVFCDIPATEGLDPKSVSFHGQTYQGTPLTWLPGDITIAGRQLYAADDVFGLGFISTTTVPSTNITRIYWLSLACGLVSLALAPVTPVPWIPLSIASLCFGTSMLADWHSEARVMVSRKRSCDGMVRAASNSFQRQDVLTGAYLLELNG